MSHCHIEETLENQGLRKTKDRHRLLELLSEARTWSASQLSEKLSVDLSTVYRNLKRFEVTGLIELVFERNGEAVYELAGRKHHDHAVCETCETPRCVPCPIPSPKPHVLQFFDTCPSCE